MKELNGICRHIGPLIRRYLIETCNMRSNNICLRPCAYNFDAFPTCSNPRRVTLADLSPAHDTISNLPTPIL